MAVIKANETIVLTRKKNRKVHILYIKTPKRD